ncbi:GNAT family N-acetyltransferase [Aliikangiella coralliicola]|uniref:GNAT family N-acetyltransferase n=1 Tax=Aliikangiella coralliicola TaxID=2592383 RepID=A0A545U4K9_9GAMM|nr:GNAT family protein [Aliikangiella coralliicola]TQV84415.1 GNAT family N-acetyltransferase [Aliikangiella coralliicola]
MSFWVNSTELKGRQVSLEPMTIKHKEELWIATKDGDLWNLWYTHVPHENDLDNYIKSALAKQREKRELPFVIRHNQSGKIIGSTRYCNIDNDNQRLEIGYTWYGKSFQKTGANTECKFLLLKHAFEELEAIAVEFRTHWLNQASRNAILRLGAKQDGVLRNHVKLADGSYRDTVVFSIINSEWPAIKNHLTHKMKQNYQS